LASNYISFNPDSPNLVLAGFDTGISWHSLEHTFTKPVAYYCTTFGSDGCHGETYTDYGYNYPNYLGVTVAKYLLTEEASFVVQAFKVLLSVFALAILCVAFVLTSIVESYAARVVVIFFGFTYVANKGLLEITAVPSLDHLKKQLAQLTLKVKSA